MSVDLRLPNINAEKDSDKMKQMQSYLYQLVQQLNWALNNLDTNSSDSSAIEIVGGKSVTSKVVEESFPELKSLIIKSADIVNAYYDVIKTRLDSVYVAESEYGSYKEESSNLIEQNAQNITSMYTDIQTLASSVNQIIATNAWTRSGLLGYDDQQIPIYGFEVGQRTVVDDVEVFNKYARFTAGGIYFYLPGVADAVAWMTGTKLYITNAEVTGSLKLGKYALDLSSGVAFKWIGGD